MNNVETFLNQHKITGNVLVGVSGGSDSVALLLLLHELREKYSLNLFVCHVNHHLRDKESDEDSKFVFRLCCELKITSVIVGGYDIKALAGERGQGIEEAARFVRYQEFEKCAKEYNCQYVAVAHTMEDQAETILFRIIRGTGIKGLAGMEAIRPLGAYKLIRPMLECSKSSVEVYLANKEQPYRKDSSNDSSDYTRNRIRNEVMPLLREFNPEVTCRIVSLGSQAGELREFINSYANGSVTGRGRQLVFADYATYVSHFKDNPNRDAIFVVNCADLGLQHPYMAREILIKAWQKAGFDIGKMTCVHWQNMYDIAMRGGSATFPGKVQVERSSHGIYMTFQKMA